MKRVIVVALAVALAPAAGAQLYKYVDQNGKTVYSDQPPANVESKQINVPSSRPSSATTQAPGPKTAVERDKELEKSRKEAADKQKKSGEAAEKAAQAEQRCAALRANYQIYAEGGRIQKLNAQGERELLGDAEIEAERARSRREMDEACKKS